MSRIVYPGGQIKAYQVGLNQADRADARAKAVLLDRFKPYAPYTTRVGLVPDPAPFVNGRFLLSSWGIGVHGAHHPTRNPVVGMQNRLVKLIREGGVFAPMHIFSFNGF